MSVYVLTTRFALAFAVVLGTLAVVAPLAAHHGWGTFDSRYAYYVSGPLTNVRWGNPHTEVTIRVKTVELPTDWESRALPPGANERNGRLTMASARPYNGRHKELHLVLAGPDWMERWGLKRRLEVGERIEAVGFVDAKGGDDLRPVMFWLANGQGVWQQLTSFPRPPEPAPKNTK